MPSGARSYAPGHTTRSGLGWQHQQTRQRALRTLQDGDLCARCETRGIEHPMYRALITTGTNGRLVAPLLDLDDFPGRNIGGPQVKRLSYAACNRAQGQAVTMARKNTRTQARRAAAGYTRW